MADGSLADRLVVAREVSAALESGRPVVALESTLITHGLPYPQNLEVARASEAAVRESGAVPATIAVRDGRILVGLADHDLVDLAQPGGEVPAKAARPNLAAALAGPGWAGTTVSATMLAARAAGIGVFATGGIGGVHRGALGGPSPSFDISADLDELARTAVVVVCAGPKAILDIRATIEYLETRGVPVVTIGQDEVPGFFSRESGVPSPISVPDLASAARLAATHLALGSGGSILVCVPIPEPDALSDDRAREVIALALGEADSQGIGGPALTPWLLARVARLTGGASLRANMALIENDARVAGQLAVLLAGQS